MELFLFWFIFAIVVGLGASQRGRSGFLWFLFAMILSPLLAVVLLALIPNMAKQPAVVASGAAAPSPDTHVKCPDCRELVFKDAKKCRFCGTTLIPQ